MVVPAYMASSVVGLQLCWGQPQVGSTRPRVAEAASAQIDAMQACQLLHLPVQCSYLG